MKDFTGNTIICRLADLSRTDVFSISCMYFPTYQNGQLSTEVIDVIFFVYLMKFLLIGYLNKLRGNDSISYMIIYDQSIGEPPFIVLNHY